MHSGEQSGRRRLLTFKDGDLVDVAFGLAAGIASPPIRMGSRAHAWSGGGGWNVAKQDLIGAVQVALEKDELRIARRMREVGSLVRELLDLQMTARSTGSVRIGADGCGQHDDLAIALALACWRARRGRNGFGDRALPGING